MMNAALNEIDSYCYDTYSKVSANEKTDDFTWDFSGGKSLSERYNYQIDLPIEEFKERQEKLLNFYKSFGFKVKKEYPQREGRTEFLIVRPNQCSINE